jgi:hypothetical protein
MILLENVFFSRLVRFLCFFFLFPVSFSLYSIFERSVWISMYLPSVLFFSFLLFIHCNFLLWFGTVCGLVYADFFFSGFMYAYIQLEVELSSKT